MSRRQRLPNRRRNTTSTFDFEGQRFNCTIGYDALDRPREIFLRAVRPDTMLDRMADDGAVLASQALQLGADPEILAKSVGSTSPIGRALQLLIGAQP